MSSDAYWPNTIVQNRVAVAHPGSRSLATQKTAFGVLTCFGANLFYMKSHWVLVVMDQFTRRIIGFGVHPDDVDGAALCHMFNRVMSGKEPPRYLSSDHDPLFEYHRWQANLRILDIVPIKSILYTPISHPFVERLIGTIRREFLDQTLFWNGADLEKNLGMFMGYYNHSRVHASLKGDTPAPVGGESKTRKANLEHYRWQTHCRELVQLPRAA